MKRFFFIIFNPDVGNKRSRQQKKLDAMYYVADEREGRTNAAAAAI
jgi:hypothetical protein